jgi:archaemetzincin
MGPVEDEVLRRIAACIEKACGMACRISEGLALPDDAFDEKRGQYDSKTILKGLLQQPGDAFRVMAVTHADIFVPILKFVFGLSLIRGRCGVISLHRLCPRFYEEPDDPDLLMARAEKTVLHELGHSLGLTHCRDRRCVMFSSTRIGDTDRKAARFCPNCLSLFRWHLDRCLHDKP